MRRESVVDGLRALALLAVIAVNWMGYASLPEAGPLGAALPASSWLAQASLALVAALLAGKGITLLAFLFGYGQGLSRRARGQAALPHRRRRMQRLLLLGLLHGVFIYMGDILTLYAISGLLMLAWSDLRLRQLWRRLIVLLALELLLSLAIAVWLLQGGWVEKSAEFRSLAQASGWWDWIRLNGGSFLAGALGQLLLALPFFMGMMTAGLMAARLRLFSHRRWRGRLQRWASTCFWPGLVLNLVWGLSLWQALRSQNERLEQLCWTIYIWLALSLLVGLVPRLVLAAQGGARFMQYLAPAGRHTLSIYIGSSLLSLLLLSGVGLGLGLSWGTATLLGLSLLYWGLWMGVAPRIKFRLPLEAWLSR
ncbi:uncharacterized protein HNP55_003871 [Paucibacter oligotrophus]|uniref:DUF418 domain-containing protein n=1 Tax=Roseateles oligotrophus TaxID=1769250 RepID=A0A840L9S4_9BURK|nr:DUF418 domain-containing protein [Roseateles oligotrophus]MBB4845324.1 uncharacterized protein [Roseateles oligotrophus]